MKQIFEGTILRPDCITEEHLKYLDDLRESGVTNMFGAGKYLSNEFDLSVKETRTILAYWMSTFGERHPEEKG